MMSDQDHHVLLIASPAQGHINPTLQLGKRLARSGLRVTFTTTLNALRLINLPGGHLDRLSFASFSTGFDDGVKPSDDPVHVAEHSKRVGSTSLHDLIVSLSNQGRRISFLIYTLMLPWAVDVARDLHIPSAFLCIQSATAFAIYNHYFNSSNNNNNNSPQSCIKLPGMPLFEAKHLPSFLLPSSPHYFALSNLLEDHIRALEKDSNPTVLVNSFDALEEHAIGAVDQNDHMIKMITIGPLIPSAFSDMSDPSDTSYGCDLFESSNTDYLSWLGSKEAKSVVYVSFGTMAVIKRKPFEEILHGLSLTGRPYLWVVRPMTHHNKIEGEVNEAVIDDVVKSIGPNLKDQGLIVQWCSQVEVLSHVAVGCFVTHCGWNSILESLVMGVPMVGVPKISDQPTNARMVEEVWRVGLTAEVDAEGVVDREELRRCVEVLMGHGGGENKYNKGEEIRKNSMKWMELGLEALMEGGSSCNNLEYFLQSLDKKSRVQEEKVKIEGFLENMLGEGMIEKDDELLRKDISCDQEGHMEVENLFEKEILLVDRGNDSKGGTSTEENGT